MRLIPQKFYLDDIMNGIMDFDSNKLTCDIYEKDGVYNLEMDIPGFSKDDIKITCDKGNITISAEKEKEEDESEKNYIRRERSYGKYSRSFYLGDINEEAIEASFENGILKIKVPKANEIETKKTIEIK